MFGYVRPVLDKLSAKERAAYKSAYCGLCHTLGKRHGWLARFTLNYDFTLLAILHYGSSGCSDAVCRRCPAHLFRKPMHCLCGEAMEAAADQSMILTWYKLCDDVKDHGFFRGLPARILRRFLRKGYQRASAARPVFETTVRQSLERLNFLESERSPQLDRVADTFATILAAAAEGTSSEHRPLEQFLYHLGRWIYLVDAWDDLERDLKKHRYNPLDARFEGKATDEQTYIETTMTHSVRFMHSAANLIEFGSWTAVIENVIYLGLPTVQKAVLDGRWNELKKQGRTAHERSV